LFRDLKGYRTFKSPEKVSLSLQNPTMSNEVLTFMKGEVADILAKRSI
uniref:ParA family protein n=1 Tax=Brugia timori TaxID=42155 RepID=A0A0R3R553_9BILA